MGSCTDFFQARYVRKLKQFAVMKELGLSKNAYYSSKAILVHKRAKFLGLS